MDSIFSVGAIERRAIAVAAMEKGDFGAFLKVMSEMNQEIHQAKEVVHKVTMEGAHELARAESELLMASEVREDIIRTLFLAYQQLKAVAPDVAKGLVK